MRLRLLTGFPVLRLSSRAVAGRRGVLAVPGRDGEPFFDVDERGEPSTSVLDVPHLPPDDRPWPQSVDRRRCWFDADGSPRPALTDDFTVVEVDGTGVGVQVDRSGAACLGWSIHRSPRGA